MKLGSAPSCKNLIFWLAFLQSQILSLGQLSYGIYKLILGLFEIPCQLDSWLACYPLANGANVKQYGTIQRQVV